MKKSPHVNVLLFCSNALSQSQLSPASVFRKFSLARHQAQIKEEIKEQVEQFISYINTTNIDSIFNNFYREEKFTFISNGLLVESYDSIHHILNDIYSNIARMKLELTCDKIIVLSTNTAIHIGQFSEKYIDKQANKVNISGSWTLVFERIKKDWKIIHLHQSYTRSG